MLLILTKNEKFFSILRNRKEFRFTYAPVVIMVFIVTNVAICARRGKKELNAAIAIR